MKKINMDKAELKSILSLLHPTDIAFIKARIRNGLLEEIMQEPERDQKSKVLTMSDLQWICANDEAAINMSDFVRAKILGCLKIDL